MKKKYYKITTEINGEQRSVAVYQTAAEVRYGVGKWVEAPRWLAEKGYYLLVFYGLKSTKEFLRGFCYTHPLRLWECEVEGKLDRLPFQLTGDSLEHGFITTIPGCKFPEGSVMVKKVKLIRQIKLAEEMK